MSLHDGRTIRFNANEYRVTGTDTAFSIEGVGIQVGGEAGREAPFRGSIASHDIRQIQVIEPTPLSEHLFPLSLGIAGGLILVYVALNNTHWAE